MFQAERTGIWADEGGLSSALHLGELEAWMDEAYLDECCRRMGWEVTHLKLIRPPPPGPAYAFLTFPSPVHAQHTLAQFNAQPPALMPRSDRAFKLNWATGNPGAQPRYDSEYSVFVGDLGRDVQEPQLVNLFMPIFPSTKSAKIMYDPITNLSRGYGFVRFADEYDMQRALLLGQNPGSGLSLHGRTLRISEASGPGNAVDQQPKPASHVPARSSQDNFGGYAIPMGPQEIYGIPPSNDYRPPTFQNQFNPAQQYQQPQQYRPPSMSSQGYGQQQQQSNASQNHTTDPNNTTVFVGGLPACISEETLKSFFHHFGEITYCKIPTGKGCGFVQFVRRADAELAIAKMNDFPIHGKSRIRLSWGRSQGDKQVEHVRKLASALGVPFEAVWRMVQGQDNSTIKQITTAVGGTPVLGSRFDALGMGRMELGAVASAAGLTEAEVMELVGGRANSSGGGQSEYAPSTNGSNVGRSEDFFNRAGSISSLDSSIHNSSNTGPYSRASPSNFGTFNPSSLGPSPAQQSLLPLSPPPSASYATSYLQQQQQQYGAAGYAAAPSPYDQFNDAGRHRASIGGGATAYQAYPPASTIAPPASARAFPTSTGNGYSSSLGNYSIVPSPSTATSPTSYELSAPSTNGTLEEAFSNLGFASTPLPPRNGSVSIGQQQQQLQRGESFSAGAGSVGAQDFFPGGASSPIAIGGGSLNKSPNGGTAEELPARFLGSVIGSPGDERLIGGLPSLGPNGGGATQW